MGCGNTKPGGAIAPTQSPMYQNTTNPYYQVIQSPNQTITYHQPQLHQQQPPTYQQQPQTCQQTHKYINNPNHIQIQIKIIRQK